MANYGIVLIDDLRSFINEVDATVIRTAADAMEWLNSISHHDTIEQLWLDHDLGDDTEGNHTSIMEFVNKLEEMTFFKNSPIIDEIVVHTSNSVGGNQIVASLERFYNVKRVYARNYLRVKTAEQPQT